ncbi:MAG: hypothetical protein KAV82_13565 [Phycisphaerae bacterium]|nr:hypothetical protein [Phycisphaerae bacterium]
MNDNPIVEVLTETVRVLDAVGIPYAVTGSVASSFHGEPYASLDVDLVCRMTPEQAGQVAKRLPQRFYRSDEMLIEAAQNCGFAHLIDTKTGLKVDLSVPAKTSFYDQVLLRRQSVELAPDTPRFDFVTAEDIVLMKLLWRKDSQSTKQWDNALGVVRIQAARLDWKYLFDQAEQLGLTDDLTALRDTAGV